MEEFRVVNDLVIENRGYFKNHPLAIGDLQGKFRKLLVFGRCLLVLTASRII